VAFRRVSEDLEDKHWQFIQKVDTAENWKIKYLHDRLSIIDAKAGSLLRVNSTIMGFLGAIVALIPRLPPGTNFPRYRTAVLIVIMVILIILALCDILSLYIFKVRFYREEDPPEVAPANLEAYHQFLAPVTRLREQILSWLILLSAIGELGFAALFISLTFSEIWPLTVSAQVSGAPVQADAGYNDACLAAAEYDYDLGYYDGWAASPGLTTPLASPIPGSPVSGGKHKKHH
jgi:hypothetical protein